MAEPEPTPESGPESDYHEDHTYLALVLLLTVPFAALISNSFPLGEVVAFGTGSDGSSFPFNFPILQLAVIILMVSVFYEVGKRVDFARSYRLLALLAFAGAY